MAKKVSMSLSDLTELLGNADERTVFEVMNPVYVAIQNAIMAQEEGKPVAPYEASLVNLGIPEECVGKIMSHYGITASYSLRE